MEKIAPLTTSNKVCPTWSGRCWWWCSFRTLDCLLIRGLRASASEITSDEKTAAMAK